MTHAAIKAGATNCKLVYEPECAAVCAVFKQVEQLRQADCILSKNDMMLVADLGAGTADFVCYQVMSDLKDPGRIQLKTVKCPING